MSEAGVDSVPSDWRLKSLGSITHLLTNGFVGTATSAYVDSDEGVLYVQGYNVHENAFNFHGIKRVTKSFHARNQKSCLQPGDLLTIQTGDIGVTAVVPHELAGANCHALVIARLDKRVSEPRFYCQYFNSERGRARFKEIETGSTMKHLNVGDMKQLLLPAPPFQEQLAIAEALSDVDTLLGALDRLIAKKRDLKQAAMQQLLTGQTRLPGFGGASPSLWRTDVGRIPRDWSVATVAELAVASSGTTPARRLADRYYLNGTVPWVKTLDLNNGCVTETDEMVTRLALRETSLRVYPTGSVLVAMYGGFNQIGRTGLLKVPAAVNQAITAIQTNREKLYPGFLLAVLNFRVHHWRDVASSSRKDPNITGQDIKRFATALPSLEEQVAIATVLANIDSELEAVEQRRAKTRALKQGMMQELLTGRVRLV